MRFHMVMRRHQRLAAESAVEADGHQRVGSGPHGARSTTRPGGEQVSKNIHRDAEVLNLAGRIWKTREELAAAASSGSDPRLLGAARDYRELVNQRAQRIAHLVDGGNVKGLSMAKLTYEPGRAVATSTTVFEVELWDTLDREWDKIGACFVQPAHAKWFIEKCLEVWRLSGNDGANTPNSYHIVEETTTKTRQIVDVQLTGDEDLP